MRCFAELAKKSSRPRGKVACAGEERSLAQPPVLANLRGSMIQPNREIDSGRWLLIRIQLNEAR
jgi:hypothetical protein